MNRKTVFFAGILLVTALVGILYVTVGSILIKSRMWDYLEQENCTEGEVARLEVRHSFANLLLSYNEWSIEVVYRDEPTSLYYYTYREGGIRPAGVTGTTGKADLKH